MTSVVVGSLKTFFVIIFITSVTPEMSYTQTKTTTQNQTIFPKYSKLTFSQDLNIFEWFYSLGYEKSLANRVNFKLREEFRSTLQSISSNDRWKDNQNLTFSLGYPLFKSVTMNADFYSHLLSDALAGFDNDVKFYAAGSRIELKPNPKLVISPKVSSKWQSQLEQNDHGIGYGIEAQANEIWFHRYRHDLFLSGEQDYFPQRQNQDVTVRYRIEKQFYQSTADTLLLFYNRLRRDNFDLDATGVFVRNLTHAERGIENRMSYRLYEDATLFLINSISSNSFSVYNLKPDTTEVRRNDASFESKHSINLNLRQPHWFSNLGWSFRARSRDDKRESEVFVDPFNNPLPPLGFDTDELYVSLDLRGGVKVTARDSIGWFLSSSKFQYDTSDSTNPNNYDQLRWQLSFSHAHRFHRDLQLVWRTSAFLNHFVYISSKFSGSNNWERVFQITPTIIYQPSDKLSVRQGFTVRAKYQTYDFDDPQTSNRNIVNRQFIVSNNSNWSITERTGVELSVNLELAEQGKIFYALWRQSLALSWQNQEVLLLFRRKFGSTLRVACGGNFFHQIRWNHQLSREATPVKRVRDKHTSVGPRFEVSYRPSDSLEFIFWGNIKLVYSSRTETQHINNFDINLNWFF